MHNVVDTGIFCSGAHVIMKAGYGVNTSISGAEAFTNFFISDAEAYINNVCQYDFTTNYPSLSDKARGVLRECCSNIAAAYQINYDMRGFSSKTEAQTMLNYLWDRAEKCLALLRDEVKNNFIKKNTVI